jgi:L-ascorbate metabolism protein UlaG (beta-lactamase superfamily)
MAVSVVVPEFAAARRTRIDAVVISHNHYDHLDVETLRHLKEVHNPRFFAGLGNAPVLERAGVGGATELDWWQSVGLGGGVSWRCGTTARSATQRSSA